jgi:hypothetical protein
MCARCMQLKRVKPIRIIVKNVIITPKKQVTNFIFMTKLAISILKESRRLKRTG